MLPDTDLVIADNIVFGTSGSRLKRQGISYWDNIELPASTGVSKTGTTVTVTFASTISDGTNKKLVVGEKVTTVCANTDCSVTAGAITGVTATTITYEVVPSGSVTTTLTSIVRSSSIVGLHDFWYFDSATQAKIQLQLAMTSQGLLFKYDSSGNRLQITQTSDAVTFDGGAADAVTLNSHGLISGQAVYFSSITSTTGISVDTVYFVGGTIAANTFQLSLTPGGAAIALTTNGSGTMKSPILDTVTKADFLTMNERCVITMDGADNWPQLFDPSVNTTTLYPLKGAPPNASILRLHQGRIFTDDKRNLDVMHYSSPGSYLEWQGVGDSGAMYIGLGDGDPEGIKAIAPTLKGNLFLSKGRTLYRMDGVYPEEFTVSKVSTGIGIASHKGAAGIDMDDVVFISDKGIHSLATTANYGDFSGTFVSAKIQNAYNLFTPSRAKYTNAVYLAKQNSLYFNVSEDSVTQQDALYLYNTQFKEWCRWPNVNASVLSSRHNNSTEQLLLGNYNSRIMKGNNGGYTDYTSTVIPYRVKTGAIYVDNNPNSIKAFKRLGFLFKPTGTYSFTAVVKIDNFAAQSVNFTRTASGDLLGTTFILGQSILSYEAALQPFTKPIDGYGRGITIDILNSGADEVVEIYGIIIEWEAAGDAQETYITGTTTE
jgi:hypothetical protein